ncbi:Rft-1-domain-containing protein [Hymenopellis radicata]|nr:Rft-1-domain-containing protein [Hymenopellis radicata]
MSTATASFGSALPLIALQLGSRVFSFVLNQALLRIATPSAFGTATIQFELLLNTILFLSREGVRTAFLRVNAPEIQHANVAFIPFLLGCPIAMTTSYLYVAYAGEETSIQPYFREAVLLYVVGALIELMKEPMHNAIMAGLQTKIRLRAEGAAVIGKSILTFLVMFYDPHKDDPRKHRALVAFALGQVFYSICVLVIYVYHFGISSLVPRFPKSNAKGKYPPFFDPQLLKLSATVTSQSLVKHFLTEGDKFILSWFSPLEDQGGYAIALNYGSLVARILLQPLEETSRSLFSQLLSKNDLVTAATRLASLLAIQIPISLLLPTFATSAPRLLSAWLWYIPFLALNGQLEAFLASAADTSELNGQSTWMAIFSVLYTGSAILAYKLQLGDTSLVYANVLNLGARIVYAAVWISEYFRRRGGAGEQVFRWKIVLPSLRMCCSLMVCGLMLDIRDAIARGGRSVLLSRGAMIHVGIGAVLGLVTLWHITKAARLSLSIRSKVE